MITVKSRLKFKYKVTNTISPLGVRPELKIEGTMKVLKKNRRHSPTQSGFSIIELMVSIALGLLVLLAVLEIFSVSMQGVHSQNNFSRVQENGRLATELIVREIRGADYWGCSADINKITNNLKTSSGSGYDASILPTAGYAIDGNNDVTSQTIASISVMDNTDTLILRGANSISSVKIKSAMSTADDAIEVNISDSIPEGDVILISDCLEADLFSNTEQTSSTNAKIGHEIGSLSTGIENTSGSLSHAYGKDAQILRPYTKVYFIGTNGAGTNSLYRADNGIANELIRGINDLQVMYGEDTNGNGSVNTFTATPTDTDQVLSIRVSLTAISSDSSQGTQLERTYNTTANIRNRTLQ